MDIASRRGKADVVHILVRAGADLNLQSKVSSLTCQIYTIEMHLLYILINNIYTMHTQLLQQY